MQKEERGGKDQRFLRPVLKHRTPAHRQYPLAWRQFQRKDEGSERTLEECVRPSIVFEREREGRREGVEGEGGAFGGRARFEEEESERWRFVEAGLKMRWTDEREGGSVEFELVEDDGWEARRGKGSRLFMSQKLKCELDPQPSLRTSNMSAKM